MGGYSTNAEFDAAVAAAEAEAEAANRASIEAGVEAYDRGFSSDGPDSSADADMGFGEDSDW